MFGYSTLLSQVALPSIVPISRLGDEISIIASDHGDVFENIGLNTNDQDSDLVPLPLDVVSAKFSVPQPPELYQWLPLERASTIRLVKISAREASYDIKSSEGSTELKVIRSPSAQRELTLELLHTDVHNSPKYDAVSYTWLDLDPEIPLRVSDGEILKVTASLYACLQRLMADVDERTIWVDQICIDQRELDDSQKERSQQIQMMHKIYGKAEQTLVWLGEEDSDSNLALETLGQIANLQKSSTMSQEALTDLGKTAKDLVKIGLRDRRSETFKSRCAVGKVLNRPWFRRAWIYQEAAVSQKVVIIIGSSIIDFERFSMTARAFCLAEQETIRRFGQSLVTNCKGYNTLLAIDQGRAKRNVQSTPGEFADMLCRMAGAVQAKEDHDLLYAFFAFQDESKPIFGSDYKIPVSLVYNSAAKRLMESTRSLDLLGIAAGHSRPNLASWAPDWSIKLPQGHLLCRVGAPSQFSACKGRHYSPLDQDASSGALLVKGQLLDIISAVSSHTFDSNDRNTGGMERFLKLQKHSETFPQVFGEDLQRNKDRNFKRLIKIMVADDAFTPDAPDVDTTKVPSPFDENEISQYLQAYKDDASLRNNNYRIKNFEGLALAHQKLRQKMLICLRKRLFCSREGRLGLAPEAIVTDDKVVVLHGCRVPCVLRRKLHENFYTFIGQCYIEGAMYGDMCDWDEEKGEVFEIR